jgi:hypothetical protein
MLALKPYANPNDKRNGPKYHTGLTCIEKGCKNPAGTYWGRYWCFECNVKRIEKLHNDFNSLVLDKEKKKC